MRFPRLSFSAKKSRDESCELSSSCMQHSYVPVAARQRRTPCLTGVMMHAPSTHGCRGRGMSILLRYLDEAFLHQLGKARHRVSIDFHAR
jgi:hypothetical protein